MRTFPYLSRARACGSHGKKRSSLPVDSIAVEIDLFAASGQVFMERKKKNAEAARVYA
jgi:hypothetical protein